MAWIPFAAFFGAIFFKKIGFSMKSEAYGPPAPKTTAANNDVDILARTVWGEARSEGRAGMQAVANVVMNRYRQRTTRFGLTIAEVCQKPKQFSCWNIGDPNRAKMIAVTLNDAAFRVAYEIAQNAASGKLTDITNGSDHYHTAAISPTWSSGQVPTKIIGTHKFYNTVA